MKEFWKEWKNVTEQEKAGIKSIKYAEKIILKNIPKNEIISIYVKGSFVRREMNEHSDVDISTILKDSKWLKKLIQIQKEYSTQFNPNIGFTGYSLWELKNNKKTKMGKSTRPGPSRSVQHLEHYKLIYGKPLKKEDFNQGDNKKRLQTMINVFKNLFLPNYEKKEFGFSEIVKQVFWLVEDEERFIGKTAHYSWKELDKSIKDKNHIIHDTLKLRLNPTKDEKIRANYLKKLNEYLNNLQKYLDKLERK